MSESEIRQWLLSFGHLLGKLADLSGTQIDDEVVKAFIAALESDLLWGYIWLLIGGLFDDKPMLVEATDDVALAAEELGISPLVIIAIVKALLEIWKLFKK
jgi:hypothetical protein